MADIITSPETQRNSYATLAEADAYHDARLHVESWTGSSDAVKSTALVWASQTLDDGYDWFASQTYPVGEQRMRFPRNGLVDRDGNLIDSQTIPDALVWATSELARLLIEQDRGQDPDTAGFSGITVGSVDLEVDKADRIQLIPFAVERLIDHFGRRINVKTAGVVAVPLVRT